MTDICVPTSVRLKLRVDVDSRQMPRQRLFIRRLLGMHVVISVERLRKRRAGARPGSSVISRSLQASPSSAFET
jgi:hypothetical protein